MSEHSLFKAQSICKRFGGLAALTDVNLTIEPCEIVGLIGPNGAGKSTFFNVSTSFYPPSSGDIYLKGERVTGKTPHEICHLGIARTFQLVKTFLQMTALENVLVGAIYGGKLRGHKAKDEALKAMELVGLAEKANMRTVHMTLSDRRLLEIARALASSPRLVMLDEPLAGLNPSETKQMMEIIDIARHKRQIAILWVEHKVDAIFSLCDKIAVLNYGCLLACGTAAEISCNEKVIEAYLGKEETD